MNIIAVPIAPVLLAGAYPFAGGRKLHGRRAEYKHWPVNAVSPVVAVSIAATRISGTVR